MFGRIGLATRDQMQTRDQKPDPTGNGMEPSAPSNQPLAPFERTGLGKEATRGGHFFVNVLFEAVELTCAKLQVLTHKQAPVARRLSVCNTPSVFSLFALVG